MLKKKHSEQTIWDMYPASWKGFCLKPKRWCILLAPLIIDIIHDSTPFGRSRYNGSNPLLQATGKWCRRPLRTRQKICFCVTPCFWRILWGKHFNHHQSISSLKLSHKNNTALLSIESWLFNDGILMSCFIIIPICLGSISCPLFYPKQPSVWALFSWTSICGQTPMLNVHPQQSETHVNHPLGIPTVSPESCGHSTWRPWSQHPGGKFYTPKRLPVSESLSPQGSGEWLFLFFHVVLWFQLGLGEPWVFFWNPYTKLTNGTIHRK